MFGYSRRDSGFCAFIFMSSWLWRLESDPLNAINWVSSTGVPLGDFSPILMKSRCCLLRFDLSLSILGGMLLV